MIKINNMIVEVDETKDWTWRASENWFIVISHLYDGSLTATDEEVRTESRQAQTEGSI